MVECDHRQMVLKWASNDSNNSSSRNENELWFSNGYKSMAPNEWHDLLLYYTMLTAHIHVNARSVHRCGSRRSKWTKAPCGDGDGDTIQLRVWIEWNGDDDAKMLWPSLCPFPPLNKCELKQIDILLNGNRNRIPQRADDNRTAVWLHLRVNGLERDANENGMFFDWQKNDDGCCKLKSIYKIPFTFHSCRRVIVNRFGCFCCCHRSLPWFGTASLHSSHNRCDVAVGALFWLLFSHRVNPIFVVYRQTIFRLLFFR